MVKKFEGIVQYAIRNGEGDYYADALKWDSNLSGARLYQTRKQAVITCQTLRDLNCDVSVVTITLVDPDADPEPTDTAAAA